MKVTVLCKVVDNFGDIGVVWRLCKQLHRIESNVEINLVVDDLNSFNKINNTVELEKSFQIVDGIQIYLWTSESYCYTEFSKNDGEKLSIILECFQCGRPDWMEKILFEDKLKRVVHILMIDYLTAEKYAEDFHCLQSLTRSAKVQKVNFMPGFTKKTGGLIVDDMWKNLKERNENGPILVFTYERDWTGLAKALSQNDQKQILIAQGRGKASFVEAIQKFSKTKIKIMEYLNQNEWDEIMKTCSVLFIRGEESMSRACLSGIPFVWHAYPQSDEYQMVKVEALLNRMKEYFSDEHFAIIRRVWLDFNLPENSVSNEELCSSVSDFLVNCNELVYGYKNFALDLIKNGDLCSNLMTYIKKMYIMDE